MNQPEHNTDVEQYENNQAMPETDAAMIAAVLAPETQTEGRTTEASD